MRITKSDIWSYIVSFMTNSIVVFDYLIIRMILSVMKYNGGYDFLQALKITQQMWLQTYRPFLPLIFGLAFICTLVLNAFGNIIEECKKEYGEDDQRMREYIQKHTLLLKGGDRKNARNKKT